MRKVDVIRQALILVYHPEGRKRWEGASDSTVRRMWQKHKAVLAGPVCQVIEEAYHFGCYKGKEPAIEPPKRLWQFYLEADGMLAAAEERRAEAEDRMMTELRSQSEVKDEMS